MSKIVIIIPTYNRESLLLDLLKNLKSEIDKTKHKLTILIYDDASSEYYERVKTYLSNFDKYQYIRYPLNHGKKKFYMLHQKMFADIKRFEFDYLIQLPDDCTVVPDFFNKSIKALHNANLDALNIFTVDAIMNTYITGSFKKEKINGISYWNNPWLDCCFISTYKFMESCEFTMPCIFKTRWEVSENRGSGVGNTFSKWAISKGQKMAHLEKSLVIHKGFESKMNPVSRKLKPCYSVL